MAVTVETAEVDDEEDDEALASTPMPPSSAVRCASDGAKRTSALRPISDERLKGVTHGR